jgi:predicted DNA-binding transcriptional regulator AlpA
MRITLHLDIPREDIVDILAEAIMRASSRSTMSAPASPSPPPPQAPKDPEELLRATEVAKLLDVEVRNLDAWRYKGQGPVFVRVRGRVVRYRRADVDEWVMTRRVRSTWEELA